MLAEKINHMDRPETTGPAFELRGRTAPVTVLRIFTPDVLRIKEDFSEKARLSPAYFSNAALMLDFSDFTGDGVQIDLADLADFFQAQGARLTFINSSDNHITAQARALGIPPLSDSRKPAPTPNESEDAQSCPKCAEHPSGPASSNTVLTQTVRSGQKVIAKTGDLVIFGSVNSGAELFALGSIHVYGALRGRALAGVQGDLGARIFCRSMSAELAAIAGYYMSSEQLNAQLSPEQQGGPAQIYLDGERLVTAPVPG